MPRIDVAGTKLEIFERGAGEALVLVHGSASDFRSWLSQVEPLSASFRVVSYSRRYHWPNPEVRTVADYTMQRHATDLEALIRALELGPLHLVGHSYGAVLCLLVALRAPELVRTLVLCEPPAVGLFVTDPPKPAQILKLLATRPRAAVALIGFAARGLAPARRAFREGRVEAGVRTFGEAVFGADGFQRLSESQRLQVRDNLTTIRAELLGPGFVDLEPARIRGIEAPTLLLTGAETVSLFRRIADRLEQLLPDVQRVEIQSARHAAHVDNPVAFNDVVLRFLRNRGGTG